MHLLPTHQIHMWFIYHCVSRGGGLGRFGWAWGIGGLCAEKKNGVVCRRCGVGMSHCPRGKAVLPAATAITAAGSMRCTIPCSVSCSEAPARPQGCTLGSELTRTSLFVVLESLPQKKRVFKNCGMDFDLRDLRDYILKETCSLKAWQLSWKILGLGCP